MSSERLPKSKELGNHIAADLSAQTLLQSIQGTFTQSSATPPAQPPAHLPEHTNAYRDLSQTGDSFLPGLAAGFSDFFSVNGKTEEDISDVV